MKANELRIGNLVNVYGIPKLVDANYILGLYQIEIAEKICIDLTPIPLTEEWLIKFGGIDNNYCIDIKCNRKTISFSWFSKIVQTGIRSGWYSKKYRHIKYVHQLQNLYFALTGTELKIK